MKNLGDKYTKRITLRLSDRQLSHLVSRSKDLGLSPSDILRMYVNKDIAVNKGVARHENVKRDRHDQL